MLKTKKAFTIVEVMIAMMIFAVLFTAMLSLLVHSDLYWSTGHNKITAQQQARLAMDAITADLRLSNTYWGSTIDNDNNRILFYVPEFNASGFRTGTDWVIYKVADCDGISCLQRKQSGELVWTTIAPYVETLEFLGSDDCVTFNREYINATCPKLQVTVGVNKGQEYDIISEVTLRNQRIVNETVEAPEEGEF